MAFPLNHRTFRLLVFPVVVIMAALSAGQGCPPPPPEPVGLPPENARVAFASQCALNVITCTVSWPDAVYDIEARPGQTVTRTATGFLVERPGDDDDSEAVQFIGDISQPGQGATALTFQWTSGASDADPCTLAPGDAFSTEPNPLVDLQEGLHYIRLTVRNDIIRDEVPSDDCGVIGTNIPSFDFVELEVEVRDGY